MAYFSRRYIRKNITRCLGTGRWFPTWLAALGVAWIAAGPAQAGEVAVAVAANFTDVTRQLVPRFEDATGHRIRASFGSTGKLYAQIENGAPFEVLLAADTARPKRLEENGLAVAGSRFTYARGRLLLWSAEPGRVDAAGEILQQGGFRHLAIANPKTAPYGLAAQQVLEAIGLWRTLQPRLVRGDNIAQTFQFVATGNAELGLVAKSQVAGLAAAERGSGWEVDPQLHRPIEQQAVLLTRGAENDAANAFLEYLRSEAARSVIAAFGYGVD